MKSLVFSLIVPLVAGQGAKCNRDNCLRAIVNSAKPTFTGVADCNSYLQVTVTPATSTIYSTLSFTANPTETFSVTDTTTLELTASTTLEVTATTETPVTVTVPFAGQKRQVTVVPSQIPAYASPCSGSVRYSSACFCAGATGTTVTAPTPSTTIYVSETATITQTTVLTASTETQLVTVQTETATNVVATKTEATTVVVTASPQPQPTFYLKYTSGVYANSYPWIAIDTYTNTDKLRPWCTTCRDTRATKFTLDPYTKQLKTVSGQGIYYRVVPGSTSNQFLVYKTDAQAAADPQLKKFIVSIGPGNALVIDQADSDYNRLTQCDVFAALYTSPGTISSCPNAQGQPATFGVDIVG